MLKQDAQQGGTPAPTHGGSGLAQDAGELEKSVLPTRREAMQAAFAAGTGLLFGGRAYSQDPAPAPAPEVVQDTVIPRVPCYSLNGTVIQEIKAPPTNPLTYDSLRLQQVGALSTLQALIKQSDVKGNLELKITTSDGAEPTVIPVAEYLKTLNPKTLDASQLARVTNDKAIQALMKLGAKLEIAAGTNIGVVTFPDTTVEVKEREQKKEQ